MPVSSKKVSARTSAVKKRLGKRNYKEEYRKYAASDEDKEYRADLQRYNRKAIREGRAVKGDNKDASHRDTDGDGDEEIAGFEPRSKNRARKNRARK